MLITCLECGLQVSDKAIVCPHCGYPMKPEIVTKANRVSTNKRKRLPNGFGQISEIKKRNLRKPFRAMVTVGKTPTGRPISNRYNQFPISQHIMKLTRHSLNITKILTI